MPVTEHPSKIAIASEGLTAEIDPMGAELFALRDRQGRDLLWNGDPAFWAGRAPILFPIVGALANDQYRVDGKVFHLPKHGFARRSLFEVVQAAASSTTLRLGWSEATLAVYPFRFELEIQFAVDAAALTILASVKNLDDAADMPASFGFHPALRWPLPYGQPRAAHAIRFEHAEPASIRRIDAAGLVKPDGLPTPVIGRDLALRDSLFEDDALIFDQITSRRVRYGALEGPSLEVSFPDTALLGVWTKPGAGFICIEPWHGWADPRGYEGDFREKPGVFLAPPGGVKTMGLTVELWE
jgi:galactose mutarotase-like enzyme